MFRETSANVEEKGKIMPEISVIVPVYNVEEYLRPCIDSILEQTFTDFELILVDDGSPDRCGEICDEYEQIDKRIRVIHQENGGLSAARNAGLDQMSGEYVTFIDSDDVVAEDYLELLFNCAAEYKAQISVCQIYEFQDPEMLLKKAAGTGEKRVISGQEAVLDMYMDKKEVPVNACSKLYHKTLFDELRFPEGKLHEDQARVPRLLFMADTVVISYNQAYGYRTRASSIMHSKFNVKRYDDVEAVEGCIRFFRNHQNVRVADAAVNRRNKLLALYTLFAYRDHVQHEVPKKYRMSQYQALKYLYKNLTDDQYTYQLAKVHPNWLLPHAYLRKVKRMLRIKVPE